MGRLKHYADADGFKVLSCNAIITEIKTNRNYGKTWLFQKRAFRRALKRGKKTIWLRLFKKETKECIKKLYTSADLQKYCGCSWYDKEHNKNGNIKREGNTLYCRKSPTHPWFWFMQIFACSDANAMRSADDVNVDTIVADEFLKPRELYSRYRGNITDDLLDIFHSCKREHEVRIFILGNKENVYNPIESYFNIKPLPHTFEGIRKYRNGSFVIQQINNLPSNKTEYQKKVKDLLQGTKYGNYIYESTYHNAKAFKRAKTPALASIYTQVYINGQPLKISVLNGTFYVNQRIEETNIIYCDVLQNKYKREMTLVKRLKQFFSSFVTAIIDNRVKYDSDATREYCDALFKWLSL